MDGDGRLVLRARLGDRAALDEIYDRYADAVHTVCLHVLGDTLYARTATQTTFALAVQGRLSPLSDPDRLCDWLAELARAASLNQPLLTRHMHARVADAPVARDLDPIALLRSAVLRPAPPDLRAALTRTFDTMAAKLARESAEAGLPAVAAPRPSRPAGRPAAVGAPAERLAVGPATSVAGAVTSVAGAEPTSGTAAESVAGPSSVPRVVDLVKRPTDAGASSAPNPSSDAVASGDHDGHPEGGPHADPPETGAHENNAPQTTAPQTTASEISAPETSAPEISAPETTTYDATAYRVATVYSPGAASTPRVGPVVFPARFPVEETFFDGDTGPLPTIARTVAAPLPLPRDRYPGWDVGWVPVARDLAGGARPDSDDNADTDTLLADVSHPAAHVPAEFRLRPALAVAASLVLAVAGVTTAVNWPQGNLRVGAARPGVPDVVAVEPGTVPPSAQVSGKPAGGQARAVAGAYSQVAAESGLAASSDLGTAIALPMPFGSSSGDGFALAISGGKVVTQVTTPAGKVSYTHTPVGGTTAPITGAGGTGGGGTGGTPSGPATHPAGPPVTDQPAPPATEPPVTKPPVTQPPVTDPPVTQPPVTDPPVTQPPVTDPPVTQPPVTDQPAPPTTPPITAPTPDPTPTVPIAAV